MLERRIKSIPIVRGRRVVGIVARRDLLEVLARSDEDIARDLEALLASELGTPSPYQVTVRDGSVTLTGPADPTSRRLATLLARGVPGVVEVRLRRGVRRWPPTPRIGRTMWSCGTAPPFTCGRPGPPTRPRSSSC